MTFKDVAVRNFRFGIRKYASFFICSTLSIAIFFIFTTLTLNKGILDFLNSAGRGAEYILFFALISIAVFAIVFINYVHNSMKKSRSKEFGLFLTLGMSYKDIRKIILIEDSAISTASLGMGLLTGLLFSRLVHMVTVNILDLEDITYQLDLRSFPITIGVFVIVFIIVILAGWFSTRKLDIASLMKSERVGESEGNRAVLKLVLGMVMMLYLVGASIAAIISRDTALNGPLILSAAAVGLIGTFLVVSSILPLILKGLRGRKNAYYQNLLVLTESRHSIGRNRKLIYILSLLSAVIIYCVSSTFSLLMLTEHIAESEVNADLEYIQAFGTHDYSQESLHHIFDSSKAVLTKEVQFPCLFVSTDANQSPAMLVSADTLLDVTGTSTDLDQGKAALVLPDPLDTPDIINASSLTLAVGDADTLTLDLEAPIVQPLFSNGTYPTKGVVLVVNSQDYSQIQNSIPPEAQGTFMRYYFKNWKKTGPIFEELRRLSRMENPQGPAVSLGIGGTWQNYQFMRRLFSTFVFICAFLSILFFAASVMVLFLRQYENLDRAKKKYAQLRRIGITQKEYQKVLTGEMRILYFLPIVFGIILGYSFMLIVESLVGGNQYFWDFMKPCLLITVGYIMLQAVFCQMASAKYCRDVMKIEL